MMRWMLVSAAVLGAWACLARAEENNLEKQDLAKFQGVWKIAAMQDNGKQVPADVASSMALYIYKNEYVFKVGEHTAAVGVFKIDPEVRTITRTDTDGDNKGKTYVGIYELDGDAIKVCWSPAGVKDPPSKFESKPGSGCCLDHLQRAPRK